MAKDDKDEKKDKSVGYLVTTTFAVYCIPLFMLAFSIHNFIALSQRLTRELEIHGIRQILNDWKTDFITGIEIVGGTEQCADGSTELFHYNWYGMRGGYYDVKTEKMYEIQCGGFGNDCEGGPRRHITNFPMVQSSIFAGKKICGKKQVTYQG